MVRWTRRESSGSIKGREFLDELSDCQLLRWDWFTRWAFLVALPHFVFRTHVSSCALRYAVLTALFCNFLHSLHTVTGLVVSFVSQPFPYGSNPVHRSQSSVHPALCLKLIAIRPIYSESTLQVTVTQTSLNSVTSFPLPSHTFPSSFLSLLSFFVFRRFSFWRCIVPV
jgi:hypothetical protein